MSLINHLWRFCHDSLDLVVRATVAMIMMRVGNAHDGRDERCDDGDCTGDSEDIVDGNDKAMTIMGDTLILESHFKKFD